MACSRERERCPQAPPLQTYIARIPKNIPQATALLDIMKSFAFTLPLLGAIISSMISTTSAANCYQCGFDGGCPNQGYPDTTVLYAARQAYCGNNLWENTQCYTYASGSDIINIGLNNPGANDQQTCWNAFEDIINQCMPTGGCGQGQYNYNNGQYIIEACGSYDASCF